MEFDRLLFQSISALAGRNAFLDVAAIFFARWVPYALIIGFFVLLAKFRTMRERLFYFAQAALVGILSRGICAEVIGYLYDRPRPFEVLDIELLIGQSSLEPSFPSGHAALYFGLALAVWFMNRKWGITYVVLASLMGVARVVVGVHWPTDILAGAALGVASAFFVRKLVARHKPEARIMSDLPIAESPGSIGK